MEKSQITKTASDILIPPSSPTTSHASIASSHKSHHQGGVQKFCSKIRHKIEDNLAPRLTSKLYKASHKHSISMSSLSIADSTSGKYTDISKQSTLPSMPAKVCGEQATNAISTVSSAHRRLTGMLKHQRQRIGGKTATKTLNKCEISAPIGEVATNSGIICPALNGKGVLTEALHHSGPSANYVTNASESATYVDSDEEYQLSLNLTKQSLEDEIFEELERAAHDESKLNAVLKNFDRLLVDYNDEPMVESAAHEMAAQHVECDVAMVEAAAAAQLELLALEPPNAFADNVGACKEAADTKCASTSGMYDEKMIVASDAAVNEVIGFQFEQETAQDNFGTTYAVTENASTRTVTTALNAANDITSTAKITAEPPTIQQPPTRPKRLEKSKSSLAIPRRNVYQTPDTPTLRTICSALTNCARSKSVWELTACSTPPSNSKIPIFKALPLQKRSKSFCSTSLTEELDKDKLLDAGTTKIVAEKQATGSAPNKQHCSLTKDARTASSLSLGSTKSRSRPVTTTATLQTKSATQMQQQNASAGQRSKRKSLNVEKLTRSNSRLQMERTKSSIGFNATTVISEARRTPSSGSLSGDKRASAASRSSSVGSQAGGGASQSTAGAMSQCSRGARKLHSSRDELLDKCLEKGHEILRKVESINTERSVRKNTTTLTKHSVKTAATLTKTNATTSTQFKRIASTTPTSSRTKVKTTATATAIGNTTTLTTKITKDACNGTLRRTRHTTDTSPITTTTSTTTKSKAAAATKHLKYANEEKVIQPHLELCKIIPPVLGEMSDKHVELLVNVMQAKPVSSATKCGACKNTNTKQLCNGEEAINFEEQQPHTNQPSDTESAPASTLLSNCLNKIDHHNNESDSDDSGHISNENDATIRTLSTSTASSVCESDNTEEYKIEETLVNNKVASTPSPSKSTKISELMEKFEKQSQAAFAHAGAMPAQQNPPRSSPGVKVCTATRVAQLEAVQCIQTRVEFYPTYSKEVTIRLL
ncbi:uncharacterized protein [Eurosta solidaginis]|uniref:uncharacterized protein n=1 Tax=Eurosta solidaginis TaxID=178769 RepID=UPI003530EB9B